MLHSCPTARCQRAYQPGRLWLYPLRPATHFPAAGLLEEGELTPGILLKAPISGWRLQGQLPGLLWEDVLSSRDTLVSKLVSKHPRQRLGNSKHASLHKPINAFMLCVNVFAGHRANQGKEAGNYARHRPPPRRTPAQFLHYHTAVKWGNGASDSRDWYPTPVPLGAGACRGAGPLRSRATWADGLGMLPQGPWGATTGSGSRMRVHPRMCLARLQEMHQMC